jgi:hypothetical protein
MDKGTFPINQASWMALNNAYSVRPSSQCAHSRLTLLPMQAGGFSILAHITAYSGRDDKLFARAIVESGTIGIAYSHPTDPPFQAMYDSLLTNTYCSSTANLSTSSQLDCIRSLPIDQFRQSSLGLIQPVFDGDMVDVPGPLAAIHAGNWTRVPILVRKFPASISRAYTQRRLVAIRTKGKALRPAVQTPPRTSKRLSPRSFHLPRYPASWKDIQKTPRWDVRSIPEASNWTPSSSG